MAFYRKAPPPSSPRPTREPFNRAMWLERYTLRREAEFVEKGATELLDIQSLISPRYRGKNNMTYESCVTAMYAKKAGGEMWKDWHEAQDARLSTREFAMTHRVAPRANMPLLRIAHSPRAQSARGAREGEEYAQEKRTQTRSDALIASTTPASFC